MSNIVKARFCGESKRQLTTEPLYQYDYGQVLDVSVIERLPASFEVHFCNKGDAVTTSSVGTYFQVEIPDGYLATGKYVYAYIVLHETENDGETEYMVSVPVAKRQDPSGDEPPTPEQQSAIDQAIAALNAGVGHVDDVYEEIDNMSATAETLPAGSSATASYADGVFNIGIPKGDKGDKGDTGSQGVPGNDGAPGQDGVSPTIDIAVITGGHRLTVTDASGTESFDVMNGEDGAEGSPGATGPAGPGVVTGGTTGQVLTKKSNSNYDTEWADPSGGADNVFAATYGSTTSAEIEIAYQAGKIITVEQGGRIMRMVWRSSSTLHYFGCVYRDVNLVANVCVCSNSVWSGARRELVKLNDFCGVFSYQTSYSAGDYIIHDGDLYKFTVDHPAGNWNASHATRVVLAEELSDAIASIPDITALSDAEVEEIVEDATGVDPGDQQYLDTLPTGGTTGQVLKKASSTDYDVEWANETGGGVTSVNGQTGTVTLAIHNVPSGGASGYVLKKTSATDYDLEWAAESGGNGVPSGGNAGQVLKKNSATDYDVAWGDMTQTYPSAYCTTAAATAAKKASCSLWAATANSWLHVLIGAANSAASALTLNVNATGAAPIYINGTASSSSNYTLPAGSYLVFYDGTNFYFRTDGKLTGDITGHADGDIAAPASPTTGDFLKWNGSAWIASALPLYNGGVS